MRTLAHHTHPLLECCLLRCDQVKLPAPYDKWFDWTSSPFLGIDTDSEEEEDDGEEEEDDDEDQENNGEEEEDDSEEEEDPSSDDDE